MNTTTGKLWYKSIHTFGLSRVYVSDNMSGKMEGIASVSTSVLLNKFCQARRNVKGSICEKCFAQATVNRYSGLEQRLRENTETLTKELLTPEEMPRFTCDIVRLESFGDLNNVLQARNYIRIARHNPRVTFTLWTKNHNFLKQAIEQEGKPENLIIIHSSMFMNAVETKIDSFFDHRFTVWADRDTAHNNNSCINCRGRLEGAEIDKCRNCMRCYTVGNTDFDIGELLK